MIVSEHGKEYYNCNRYNEKTSVDARDAQAVSRKALQRYLHYFNRYANHQASAKQDQGTLKKIEAKMLELQTTSDMSWIQAQFLRAAVLELSKCRVTLRWTYAFAYYLERNNETEIFEDNQRDLEMAVDQLSEFLTRPVEGADGIAVNKQVVLDKTAYVASRLEVVLADTAQGLVDGRWAYNIDVP